MKRDKLMPSLYLGSSKGVESPIFFNLHASVTSQNEGGGAPVTVITGGPGSGKTFCGLNLTAQAAILGYTIIVIDYKGDFAILKNIEDEISKEVTIWQIRDEEFYGALDPFVMTNNLDERVNIIITLAGLFAGGLSSDEESAIGDVIYDAAKRNDNTLEEVVHALQGNSINNETKRVLAQNVGTRMANVMKVDDAKICFATKKRGGGVRKTRSMKIKPGSITIATLLGLSLPKSKDDMQDDYSMRAAAGILYLLTKYVMSLLETVEDGEGNIMPKLLVIDEAWAILSTAYGENVVKQASLLGRSRNVATLLITQSPEHYQHLNIENTIGTRICFRASAEEAKSIVKDTNLPTNEGWEDLLVKQQSGECLFAGRRGRFSLMQIDVFKPEWREAFETDPTEFIKRKRRIKERQLARNS